MNLCTNSDTEGVSGLNITEDNMSERVEEKGIKELQELNEAINNLAVEIESQTKDGKLSIGEIFADLPEAYKVIEEAKDYKEIIAEIKDLDETEAKLVCEDYVTLIFLIRDIVSNFKR